MKLRAENVKAKKSASLNKEKTPESGKSLAKKREARREKHDADEAAVVDTTPRASKDVEADVDPLQRNKAYQGSLALTVVNLSSRILLTIIIGETFNAILVIHFPSLIVQYS